MTGRRPGRCGGIAQQCSKEWMLCLKLAGCLLEVLPSWTCVRTRSERPQVAMVELVVKGGCWRLRNGAGASWRWGCGASTGLLWHDCTLRGKFSDTCSAPTVLHGQYVAIPPPDASKLRHSCKDGRSSMRQQTNVNRETLSNNKTSNCCKLQCWS